MTIDTAFFKGNRKKLASQYDGVVVVTAYSASQLTGDMATPFRQEANFWYLTGIEEPDWQLIMANGKSWLVAPIVSEIHRVFDGGLTYEMARRRSGVDKVVDTVAAKELLAQLAERYETAYGIGDHPHQKYFNFVPNPAPGKLWRRLKRQFKEVQDIRLALSRLRAIKQPAEIETIKKAIDITVATFAAVKPQIPKLRHEYQVEAEFTYAFRRQGATHAYDPIVASGGNACTMHYLTNDDEMTKTDLVLLDIGARVEGYPADITRTYTIGQPTKRQRHIHDALVVAHRQIIDVLTPGLRIEQYETIVDDIMKATLASLDLLRHERDYRRYFPHAISHGLGVDVHDSLGRFEALQPGMVLTVEPGIYIPEEGIGIRLEDDILITGSGYENLSNALPLDL